MNSILTGQNKEVITILKTILQTALKETIKTIVKEMNNDQIKPSYNNRGYDNKKRKDNFNQHKRS